MENTWIDGVIVSELIIKKDIPDREGDESTGIFMEVWRHSHELVSKMVQSNFSITNPGVIKAFHAHKYQDDLFFFASGKVMVVLCDLRLPPESPKHIQVIFAGKEDYKTILIPSGVAHGFKVVSSEPAMLFYHVTNEYNSENPDEQKIDPFAPFIGFDWNVSDNKDKLGPPPKNKYTPL